jgi:hypothetical protein
MSKFEIITSKGKSLHKLSQLNKIIYITICLIFPVLALAGPVATKLGYGDNVISTTLLIWIIVVSALVVLAQKINKSIVKHGELNLGTSYISKNIGGIIQQYSYHELSEIKIRKHIRSILYLINNDGSKTYLVTLKKQNNETEKLVVSSQSIDKPDTNFKDFFRKLEKRTGNKVNVI